MNDQLKDFVEKHREDFDHLEAPMLKLDQLRPRSQQAPLEARKTSLFQNTNKWLAAASILLTIACVWLIWTGQYKSGPTNQIAQHHAKSSTAEVTEKNDVKDKEGYTDLVSPPKDVAVNPVRIIKKRKASDSGVSVENLYTSLKDSTSASARLLAILEIEKSGKMDNVLINMLNSTLNHDGNTNVRLAALSLLEKYKEDKQVSSMLVNSLNKQNDPMVQLGLVSLLGKMKNIEIDDKLQSLANDPNTFAAVRDEAYSILLNQNKL